MMITPNDILFKMAKEKGYMTIGDMMEQQSLELYAEAMETYAMAVLNESQKEEKEKRKVINFLANLWNETERQVEESLSNGEFELEDIIQAMTAYRNEAVQIANDIMAVLSNTPAMDALYDEAGELIKELNGEC
jgi:hypothetical protein